AFDQQQIAAMAVDKSRQPMIQAFGGRSVVRNRGLAAFQFARYFFQIEWIVHATAKRGASRSLPQIGAARLAKDCHKHVWQRSHRNLKHYRSSGAISRRL